MGGHQGRGTDGRGRGRGRLALALVASLALHAAAAVGLMVLRWAGIGGWSVPARMYAVEIVGVSADPSLEPQAPEQGEEPAKPEEPPREPPEPEKPPEPAKPEKPDEAEDKKPPRPARPRPTPPAEDELAVKPEPAEKDESAPELRDAPPQLDEPRPPDAAEPAIPWPLDEPMVAAAARSDLPGAAPGDASLLLALRMDRLRGTPWAPAAERILAPMPDYRTVMTASPWPVHELFDLVFVATPDPRDVSATFLAARHTRSDELMRDTLAGPVTPPRVEWRPAAGGMVGERTRVPGKLRGDPRVFLVPEPGWIVLARPEHLPGMLGPVAPVDASADAGPPAPAAAAPARPRWMQRLVALVGDPGASAPGAAAPGASAPAPEGGPVAIMAVANLGPTLVVAGVGKLPAPAATVISVFLDGDGFRVVGVFDFASDAVAAEFAASAEKVRKAVLGSAITRHFIAQAGAEKALRDLRFATKGKQVAGFARISGPDATKLLKKAAEASEDWFEAVARNAK